MPRVNRIVLDGIDGSTPLGFMASLGLLRIVHRKSPSARIGFTSDGSFRAFLEGFERSDDDVAGIVAKDAEAAEGDRAPWRFRYIKSATKRKGPQEVADLKPPPEEFRKFLATAVEEWLKGEEEAAGYAAAYATDVAVDGNGNTKPTAFHFTAANQTFLGTVEAIRASVTAEWAKRSLFVGHSERPGPNLRWNPAAERNRALMASDPSNDSTRVDAPLEWLAFRGLPLLPSFPRGSRIITTGVVGRAGETRFIWPLWSVPASLQTIRSVLHVDWAGDVQERRARGIFAICTSTIRRTSQGFGNFGPSSITS